jgi:hypothetical protein
MTYMKFTCMFLDEKILVWVVGFESGCNLGLIAMLVVAEQQDITIIKLYRYQIWDMNREQSFPSL